jgi:hypothetical protein
VRFLTRCGALGVVVLASAAFLCTPATASVPANGRAWELVTPEGPIPANVHAAIPLGRSGNRVVYMSFGPMPGATSGPVDNLNLAVRGEDGWRAVPGGVPYSAEFNEFGSFGQPIWFAGANGEEITSIWLSKAPLSTAPLPEGDAGLYHRGPGDQYTLIADLGSHNITFAFPSFIDQSENEEHVIFTTEKHLVPTDAGRTEGSSVYDYDAATASLRQVDVDTGGALLSSCGSAMSHENGVSADGERIFFTNPAPSSSCAGPSEVYLREGHSHTIEISASQCTRANCNSPQNVSFVGASADGEDAFLVTTQQLTNEDEDELPDLYRYDVSEEKLSLVSSSPPGAEGSVRNGPVYSSNDGSYVYFVANGQLLPGQGSEDGTNMYLSDPSGLHFVAEDPAEEPQITGDGRSMLLASFAPLTEGDVDSNVDIYLYHADDGSLTWISRGSAGGNGPFNAELSYPQYYESVVGKPLVYRAISEDGEDAFFSTEEQLVPEDVNEVTDVYEWKDGHVGLISSGTGHTPSVFGGVSADGQTALFWTRDSLLPADRDGGEADLYVARVDGGFPEADQPATPCEGVSCQAASSVRASRPIPASYAKSRPKHRHTKSKHRHKAKRKHAHRHRGHGRSLARRGGAR